MIAHDVILSVTVWIHIKSKDNGFIWLLMLQQVYVVVSVCSEVVPCDHYTCRHWSVTGHTATPYYMDLFKIVHLGPSCSWKPCPVFIQFYIDHSLLTSGWLVFDWKAFFFLVCSQMAAGVSVIIGPSSSVNVKASYPMTMGFHVPMISPGATDPMLESSTYRYTTGRIQINGLTTLSFLFL